MAQNRCCRLLVRLLFCVVFWRLSSVDGSAQANEFDDAKEPERPNELVVQSRDNNRITAFRKPTFAYHKYQVYAVYANREHINNTDVYLNFVDYVVLVDIRGRQLVFTPLRPDNEHDAHPISAMQVGFFLTPTERILNEGSRSSRSIPPNPNAIPYNEPKPAKISPRLNLTFFLGASYIMSPVANTALLRVAEELQPNELLNSVPGNGIFNHVFSGFFIEQLGVMLRYRPLLMGVRLGASSSFYYKPVYQTKEDEATSLQYTPTMDVAVFGTYNVVFPLLTSFSTEVAAFVGGGLSFPGFAANALTQPNLAAEAGLMFSVKSAHIELSIKTLDAEHIGGANQDLRLGLGFGLSLKPFQDLEKGIAKDDKKRSLPELGQ